MKLFDRVALLGAGAFLALLTACGGGGGGGDAVQQPPPPPPAPLRVLSASSVQGVNHNFDTVRLTFDAAVDASAIGPNSVQMRVGDKVVPVEVSVADAVMTVTAVRSLHSRTTYSLTVKAGLRSRSGGTLASDYTHAFTTPRIVFDARFIVPAEDVMAGAGLSMIAAGDMDGDGRMDLVVLGRAEFDQYNAGFTLRIYRQDDQGQFTLAQRIDQPYGFNESWDRFALLVIDLDHDGVPEIVVPEHTLAVMVDLDEADTWGGLRIFARGADGRFALSTMLRTPFAQRVHVVDVDGDGFDDLIGTVDQHYAYGDARGQQAFLSSPTGLQPAPPVMNAWHAGFVVAADDFNRDGHMDLLALRYKQDSQAETGLLVGDGRGGFSYDADGSAALQFETPYLFEFLASKSWAPTADVNGDGWPDFPTLDYLSNGDGSYSSSAPLPRYENLLPGLVDWDRDGQLDLASMFFVFQGPGAVPHYLAISFGQPDWNNTQVPPEDLVADFLRGWLSIPEQTGMLATDMDGDGYPDAVLVYPEIGIMLVRQLPEE